MPTTGASRSRSSRRRSRWPRSSSSRCREAMILAPFYREFDLPWEGDPESSRRFRKILRVLLVILVVLSIAFPLLPVSKRAEVEEVPERSEEHTSELQSLTNLVCRLLLEKKKKTITSHLTSKRASTNNMITIKISHLPPTRA